MSMSNNRLPAPTTLGNHIIAPRSGRSSRSQSHSLHTSASSSRHSSVSRPTASSIVISGSAHDLEMDLDAEGGCGEDGNPVGLERQGLTEDVNGVGNESLDSTSTLSSDPSQPLPNPSTTTLLQIIENNDRPIQRRTRRRAFTIHDEVQLAFQSNQSVVASTPRLGGVSSTLTPITTSADEGGKSDEPRRKRRKPNPPKMEESSDTESDSNVELIALPGELALGGPAQTLSSIPAQQESSPLHSPAKIEVTPEVSFEGISDFTCPVCFSAPMNATTTLCGHVMCGQCLFAAVKAQLGHGAFGHDRNVARCPVCREELEGWDGLGGGVIGLHALAIDM